MSSNKFILERPVGGTATASATVEQQQTPKPPDQLQGVLIWLAVSVFFSVVASFLPGGQRHESRCGRLLRMSKKSSLVTLVIVIVITGCILLGRRQMVVASSSESARDALNLHGLSQASRNVMKR
jgi:hypothetical protein